MERLQAGDLVLLVARDRKQHLVRLQAGQVLHTRRGQIRHDDLIGQPAGREIRSHMDYPFLVLEPSTGDLIQRVKRVTQIMFPKDVAHVIMRLNLFSGRRAIEAGTGSGGMTLALARQVMPTGRVYSYESNPDAQKLARANLQLLGLDGVVELKLRDVEAGFDETDVDAVFLDLRSPWRYLMAVSRALKPGGYFGAILPTANQVIELLAGLQEHGEFAFTEVEELILRPYKAVPGRFRPMDRIIAHTGYLIFARRVVGGLDKGWALPSAHGRRRALEELDGADETADETAHEQAGEETGEVDGPDA